LVWTGYRWHVRAWCEKNQDFRDFVLSRFRGEADLMDSSERNASEDNDWQQRVTLQVEPDPRLRVDQREVIAHDYNMENGRLLLTTRAKLAPYLLQLLNVNTGPLLDDPRAQQLVLSNQESLQNWLM
jgi:predicted DNA-binding transcriptional regulator YafY